MSPVEATPEHNHTPPWLFGVVILPYGFSTSVTAILMPYLLRKAGMPVDRIAEIEAIALLPAIWSFLWAPLADTGLRRRSWMLVSSVASGLAGAAAVFSIHGSVPLLTSLLFLTNAFTGLLSSACGALLAAMPEAVRGRSGGWYQTGNVGGAALCGGLMIWLADRVSLPLVAVITLALMVLPAFAAQLIEEAPPLKRALGPQLQGMMHDLRDVLRSPRTWLALLFLLSPVGTAAVGNLISGVGQDYRASGDEVLWVTGVTGGLITTAGCFFGGWVADRINRMVAYALAGVLTAIFGAWLAFAPPTPFTYGAAYSGYCVATGFSYAVYTALLLDVVGRRKHAAAFAYSSLNAVGNAAIAYMVWADGVGYKHWGVRGMMGVDAGANAGAAALLLLVAWFAGRYWNREAA